MVIKGIAEQIKAAVDGQLILHGIGKLTYALYNWETHLYFVFPKDTNRKYNKTLSSIAKTIIAKFPREICASQSSFFRDIPDEDCEAENVVLESPMKDSLTSRYPIEDCDDLVDSGAPCIEIVVDRRFACETDEEASYRLREESTLDSEYDPSVLVGNQTSRLLPIPPPPRKKNSEVYLTMAYEPYDMIEKGEKRTEYRVYTDYYVKKLLSQPVTTVLFQRGYGGPGHDAPRQMRWSVVDVKYYDCDTEEVASIDSPPPDFCPTHIAIELGKRIS